MNDDVVDYIRSLEGRIAWLELQLQELQAERQSRRAVAAAEDDEAKKQDRLRSVTSPLVLAYERGRASR